MQPLKVLADQGAQRRVERTPREGEVPLQVRTHQVPHADPASGGAQHPEGEVDAHRVRRTSDAELRQVAARSTAQIEHLLARSRIEQRERMALVHRYNRVRRVVIAVGPQVVARPGINLLATRRRLHATLSIKNWVYQELGCVAGRQRSTADR